MINPITIALIIIGCILAFRYCSGFINWIFRALVTLVYKLFLMFLYILGRIALAPLYLMAILGGFRKSKYWIQQSACSFIVAGIIWLPIGMQYALTNPMQAAGHFAGIADGVYTLYSDVNNTINNLIPDQVAYAYDRYGFNDAINLTGEASGVIKPSWDKKLISGVKAPFQWVLTTVKAII